MLDKMRSIVVEYICDMVCVVLPIIIMAENTISLKFN